MATPDNITDYSYNRDEVIADVTQNLPDEDTFLQEISGLKPASPYTVCGVTMVQAHVSPVENLRVTGAPRVDIQFTLSDSDAGVEGEEPQ